MKIICLLWSFVLLTVKIVHKWPVWSNFPVNHDNMDMSGYFPDFRDIMDMSGYFPDFCDNMDMSEYFPEGC